MVTFLDLPSQFRSGLMAGGTLHQTWRRQNDLLEKAYTYITSKTYPDGASSNEKRTIRLKSAKFVVRNGELLYTKCRKKKDGEKVAKATCTYSHQYSTL